MNGRAWVVEIAMGRQWEPANSYPVREWARRKARNMRTEGWQRVRVRKYVRVEAGRGAND